MPIESPASHPQWAVKHKKPGTELCHINGINNTWHLNEYKATTKKLMQAAGIMI